MSHVTDYVDERKNQVADAQTDAAHKKALKRVTVRLNGDSYLMLTEIAKSLQDTTTGCAEELLAAAIAEAWNAVADRTQEDKMRVLSHYRP